MNLLPPFSRVQILLPHQNTTTDYENQGTLYLVESSSPNKLFVIRRNGDERIPIGDDIEETHGVTEFKVKANHIYFTDDNILVYAGYDTSLGGGKDMGIYNMEDGSFTPHFKGQSISLRVYVSLSLIIQIIVSIVKSFVMEN